MHFNGCYSTREICAHVHALVHGVLPKNMPRVPHVCLLGGCYSTRQAAHYWCALVLLPVCHCTPRGACSTDATVPIELHAASTLWHMLLGAFTRHYAPLGATSPVLQYPLTVPCVHTGCSPLHATIVPRMPAMHGEGKSPPTDESEIG